MSYRKALKDAECFLEQAGVPDAGIDAWYLMEYVLKQKWDFRCRPFLVFPSL